MTASPVAGPVLPALRPAAVLNTWWPLAASWLLMGIEIPMMAAVVARLPDPKIHLAAFGIVFPLALMIEAPIIMMLAASTALSTDSDAFRRLRRFMTQLAFVLTLIQIAFVATPGVFAFVAGDLMGAPDPIVGPARLGFAIMIPWTWAIADRRFHQGLLIRFGRQHLIGVGTAIRLLGTAVPLAIGLAGELRPGIAVAGAALTTGVLVEAIYTRICARSIQRGALARAAPGPVLDVRRLLRFYTPLALTPVITLLAMPIGAAGLGRMPVPIASLAVWPVVNGLVFMARGMGMAFNEVTVRHAGDPGAAPVLRRLAIVLGIGASLVLTIVACTPAARWWFVVWTDLEPELAGLAGITLFWGLLLPLLTFAQSFDQGLLVYRHRTRGVTEAVAVSLASTTIVLVAGAYWDGAPGAVVAMFATTIGALTQAAWLRWRVLQLLAHD